ncbi:MAG: hypothetical protein MUC78_03475 [Bacteroidales bacterium]|nr:hypothetical protein [Bacteroidales bacterium]
MVEKIILLFLSYLLLTVPPAPSQELAGFKPSGVFGEQQMVIENSPPGTRILINAPLTGFGDDDRVLIVFYALPNGNTIEQTFGKKIKVGDDWHFDIQHIAAQTRFLRNILTDRIVVVAYLENDMKSWPAWKAATPDYRDQVRGIIDEVTEIFSPWRPELVLNGHSGGGRFIFSYLDALDEIPSDVVRIAFLDSNYGYEDTIYGPKLVKWIKSGNDKYLCTLAYNDSVVVYNGKPLVSPTGGTWYRSKMMLKYFSSEFRFREKELDSLSRFRAERGRIEFNLKPNPEGRIYHTRQVEYNGFIHSMLNGTKYEQKGYRYFGERAYTEMIADTIIIPLRRLNIPNRDPSGETGTAFMIRINDLPLEEREEEIFRAASSGNIPDFLRQTLRLKGEFEDLEGTKHIIEYEVMPDYLAIGSDDDFCRIPMNPRTAQRLADLFGASMLTAKLSDHIWAAADIKLTPFNYVPVGNANELVTKFGEHNAQIEKQLSEAGGHHGQLVAGIKKDVIISSRIADRTDRVVLYGWHKPDSKPIQPVYSGHIWWYVDYSHGIRFINNQVILDGKPALFTDILKDSVLFQLFSNEPSPMLQPFYTLP